MKDLPGPLTTRVSRFRRLRRTRPVRAASITLSLVRLGRGSKRRSKDRSLDVSGEAQPLECCTALIDNEGSDLKSANLGLRDAAEQVADSQAISGDMHELPVG